METVRNAPDLLAPIAPNDGMDFEQLAVAYNFRNISDRRRVFASLVLNELRDESDAVVLDIGCGSGMGRDARWQQEIGRHCHRFIGIEPDTSCEQPPFVDEFHQTVMEDADLAPNSVDVAYSFMVMEHVADPRAFLIRLHAALKPGGVYLFMTPNGQHYFTRVASAAKSLGISDLAVRLLRGEKADEYHYPVMYRFNHAASIRSIATETGFENVDFAYLEVRGPHQYFPGPLKIFFHALSLKRRLIKRNASLMTMIGRLQKA